MAIANVAIPVSYLKDDTFQIPQNIISDYQKLKDTIQKLCGLTTNFTITFQQPNDDVQSLDPFSLATLIGSGKPFPKFYIHNPGILFLFFFLSLFFFYHL